MATGPKPSAKMLIKWHGALCPPCQRTSRAPGWWLILTAGLLLNGPEGGGKASWFPWILTIVCIFPPCWDSRSMRVLSDFSTACRNRWRGCYNVSTACNLASISHIPIEAGETLTRYALKAKWCRPDHADKIRYEVFLPYSRVELSVTRQRNLSEHRLWGAGRCAATKRIRSSKGQQTERIGLHGRFDFPAGLVPAPLALEASEGPAKGPLNHVNIKGFPASKASQQKFAMLLAEAAVFVEVPREYAIEAPV